MSLPLTLQSQIGHPEAQTNTMMMVSDVLEQCMKGHHTIPMNFTELWTELANIWQVIAVEHFQKLVESMPHHVAAVIKTRGAQLVTR
ncbi:hypothetical protein TNCV_3842971 [Trichonephila clavipes]|nr:hypothetical protein TNCV_3842971 [Trichonephila clavipes]